jgi:hypothetical protein
MRDGAREEVGRLLELCGLKTMCEGESCLIVIVRLCQRIRSGETAQVQRSRVRGDDDGPLFPLVGGGLG